MPFTYNDIEAVIDHGLVADIFKAERAIGLLRISGARAHEINTGRGNFGSLFGAFQGALTTDAVLAIARLHDRPNPKYPTRCLRGVLQFLSEQHQELPPIRHAHHLCQSLSTLPAPPELLKTVEERPNEFAPLFAAFATSLLGTPERTTALEDLKRLRDKALAHNEHVAALEGPTWDALVDLVELAKQVVGALGWAYVNTAYVVDGKYLMSEDAAGPSRALNRLLDALYRPAAVQ
jgi:hypothetical protein